MSKRKLCPALALALATALAAAPATAQDEDWTVKWDNGFKLDSPDGRFKLKWGGRIQADYSFFSADDELEAAFGAEEFQDGFEFRRARLFVEGEVYERVGFKAEYDFAGAGDPTFKDVYIALASGAGDIKFGHFKEPFSLEELTSSKYIAFLERSLPIEAFAPSRNSGVGLGTGGDRFNWGVGAFYDADDFALSASEGRVNLTGRIGFRPVFEGNGERMLHFGLAASQKDTGVDGTLRFRTRPEAHLTTRLVDTGTFEADSAMLLGAELAGVFHRFWFAGEYILNDVDAPVVGDPTFDGYYAAVGFYLTDDYRRFKASDGAFDRQKPGSSWLEDGGRGAWEVLARASSIDLSEAGVLGGEQDDLTVGLNWYPNPVTRLMINYVLADVDGVGELDSILVRWAIDF